MDKIKPQIIIYKSEDGKVLVDTLMRGKNIWLSQKMMALLFDCSADNISLHLKNIFKTGELDSWSTSEDFSVVQKEIEKQESLEELERDIKELKS